MNTPELLLVMAGRFIFGWGTCNFVYGRKGCDDCFIGLITGKRCSKCENNREPPEVKSP